MASRCVEPAICFMNLSESVHTFSSQGRVPVDVDIYEREMRRGRLNSHDHALVVARAPPGFMYTPVSWFNLR